MKQHLLVPGSLQGALCLAALWGLSTLSCSGLEARPAGRVSDELASKQSAPGELGPPRGAREARLVRALEGLVFKENHVYAEGRLPAGPQEAERWRNEGLRALRSGHRIRAVELIKEAVLRAPDRPEAYVDLGGALLSLGRSEAARAAFLSALRLDSGRRDAWAGLARSLEMEDRLRDAVKAWHEALSISEDDAIAHSRLAVDLYYLGDLGGARHHLAEAHRRNGPVPAALDALLMSQSLTRAPRAVRELAFTSPVRVDSGGAAAAAETSVILGRSKEVVAAWNDLREDAGIGAWSLGVGLSQDGGATWSDSILSPPGAPLSKYEGDPMTAHDPRTGNFWVGGVTFTDPRNIFVARKPPGTSTFEPVVLINENSFFDKGWLAAGPAPGDPDSTRLYVAYNEGLQVSSDLGETWSQVTSLGLGVGQHPRIGPAGELYISYWDFSDGMMLLRSFDGGATLSPPIRIATRMDVWGTQDGSRLPGRFRVATLAYLAVDPNVGTLYCVYFDTTEKVGSESNVDLYFTRSSDRGTTWTTPVVINGDADPPGDQFFPWLEVDRFGTLHLAFLDTRNTAQMDDTPNGFFDVYYATSRDGGESWSEIRLTASPFASADALWPDFEQFLGDFIGMTVDGDQALVLYPATFDGELDIYAQRVSLVEIFAEDFELGNLSAWSKVMP